MSRDSFGLGIASHATAAVVMVPSLGTRLALYAWEEGVEDDNVSVSMNAKNVCVLCLCGLQRCACHGAQ